MKKLLLVLVVAAFGFNAYQRAQVSDELPPPPQQLDAANLDVERAAPAKTAFQCDGRVYCSQMKSCEEARYFLQNCPGVQMDGDRDGAGDGIPCERQWCRQQ